MTAGELTRRVTRSTAVAVVPVAFAGGWLGGASGAVGVLAGGALALVGFRALAARVMATTPTAPALSWLLVAALRFVAVAAVTIVLFAGGWVHPVGVLAGYSALPLTVLLQGLCLIREERNSWT
jgi:hypothetical protein